MQIDDKVHQNHSQLEEFRESQTLGGRERLRNRRLNIISGNPVGRETPLGHTYSIILEALAREGIDVEPNPQEFLNYITGSAKRDGDYFTNISLTTPTFYPRHIKSVLWFMRENGLSAESCEILMFDIVGNVDGGFEESLIERYYPIPS